jgi:tetratricopeptide (TPR) repeat protein
VDFIDSAGLGVLVGLKMTTNKNKSRLILVSPSKAVHDILYISKLDSIFDIVTGNEAEAIRTRLAVTANLIRSIAKEPPAGAARGAPAGVEAAAAAAAAGAAAPSVRPTPAPKAAAPPLQAPVAFSIGTPPPAPAPPSIQEPVRGAGLANRPGGDEVRTQGLRDKVEQWCRDAVEYMRQGDYDRAAECYLKAVEQDPEYLPAHNNLAIVYEKKPAWHQKAIEQWEKVQNLSQKHGDQKHLERATKHLSNLRRL